MTTRFMVSFRPKARRIAASGRRRLRNFEFKFRQGLVDVVTSEQMDRVDQIMVQFRGIDNFTNPDFIRPFEFTEEQKERIREIRFDCFRELGEFLRATQQAPDGVPPQAYLDKKKELRSKALEQTIKEFSRQQAQLWCERVGKPFEVK